MNDNPHGHEGGKAAQEQARSELVSDHGWDEKSVRLGIRARFRCEYCGRDLLRSVDDYDSWQIDHITPKTEVDDNCEDNLAVACKTCNFLKRDWMPDSPTWSSADRKERIRVVRAHVLELRDKKEVRLQRIRQLAHRLEDSCVTEE